MMVTARELEISTYEFEGVIHAVSRENQLPYCILTLTMKNTIQFKNDH